MVYYHVYIAYTDKKEREHNLLSFNRSKEHIKQYIVRPYMKNETFIFCRKVIHPSIIDELAIYKSEKDFRELILPSGEPIIDADNIYIVKCFGLNRVEGVRGCTYDFIPSPPEEKEKPSELTTDLMQSASFLGLDTNWSLATCALQLQEVAVTLVAKRKNIKLDKANVEKVLNKKIEELFFNDQYKAFSRQMKDMFNIEMPILTTHLRRMRVKVLHEGYNPKPEETESIASFTTGLLRKLEDIS